MAGHGTSSWWKLREMAEWLLAAFYAIVTLGVLFVIFVGFIGSDKWVVFALCLVSWLGGIVTSHYTK